MNDHIENEKIQARMMECTRKLHDLVPKVAAARQVKEFISDRRKVALSLEVVKFLKDLKHSVASAEHLARAEPAYQAKMETLAKQAEAAEATIAEWAATMCSYEAARSLLSYSKATITELS